MTFNAAVALVGELDHEAEASAHEHHDRLTKPRGALGRLEGLGVRLAAIAGVNPPPRPTPAAVAVFAADHGVVAEGVTPWPQEVTGQMVANFIAGSPLVAHSATTGRRRKRSAGPGTDAPNAACRL